MRQGLFAPEGKSTKWLKVLDEELGKDPMTTPTIGNIYAFCIVNMFRPPTFLDGLNDADIIDGYENVKKHHNWVANLPEVKALYEGREDRKARGPRGTVAFVAAVVASPPSLRRRRRVAAAASPPLRCRLRVAAFASSPLASSSARRRRRRVPRRPSGRSRERSLLGRRVSTSRR